MKYTLPLLGAASAVTASFNEPILPRQSGSPSGGNTQQTCYDGVYQIVARASTEPPGIGIIGAVAKDVSAMIPNSHIEAVVYPASLNDYFNSERQGVTAMTQLLKNYVDACPDGRVILMGYSQGAAVVGDTLCGTSDSEQSPTDPIDFDQYGSHVVGIVSMGDPTFVTGLPWDRGTAKTNGTFPRENTQACEPYANIWRSYCDNDDVYCASGNSIIVHISYTANYETQATDFLTQAARNATMSNNGSSGGSAGGSSGSGSSSSASSSGSSGPAATGSTTSPSGGMSGTGSMSGGNAQETGAAVRSAGLASSMALFFGIAFMVAYGM